MTPLDDPLPDPGSLIVRFDTDDKFWSDWARDWIAYGMAYATNNPEPRVVPVQTLTIHEGPCPTALQQPVRSEVVYSEEAATDAEAQAADAVLDALQQPARSESAEFVPAHLSTPALNDALHRAGFGLPTSRRQRLADFGLREVEAVVRDYDSQQPARSEGLDPRIWRVPPEPDGEGGQTWEAAFIDADMERLQQPARSEGLDVYGCESCWEHVRAHHPLSAPVKP